MTGTALTPRRTATDPSGQGYGERATRRPNLERVARGPAQHAEREIRDVAGETTIFAVPAHDRMLYTSPTDHPIGVQESIGSARPMNASAVGKAYLAALEPTRLDIVLGRLSYTEGTDRASARRRSSCGTCSMR